MHLYCGYSTTSNSEQLQGQKCLLEFQEDCQEVWMLNTATRQDLTWTCTHWCVVTSWQASCWLWLSSTRHSGTLLAAINPCVLWHWLDLEGVLTFLLMLLRCLEGNLTGEDCREVRAELSLSSETGEEVQTTSTFSSPACLVPCCGRSTNWGLCISCNLFIARKCT